MPALVAVRFPVQSDLTPFPRSPTDYHALPPCLRLSALAHASSITSLPAALRALIFVFTTTSHHPQGLSLRCDLLPRWSCCHLSSRAIAVGVCSGELSPQLSRGGGQGTWRTGAASAGCVMSVMDTVVALLLQWRWWWRGGRAPWWRERQQVMWSMALGAHEDAEGMAQWCVVTEGGVSLRER
jgi:hypothetical protein